MKTVLISLFSFLCLYTSVAKTQSVFKKDCDVCSTSTNSTSINFDFNNQNYIGLIVLYQNYKTYNGIFNNSKRFNEYYRTLQFGGNYMITSKWNLTTAIPVHIHNRILEDSSIKQDESGLGDIFVQSTYQVLQSDSLNSTRWTLKLGAGIKAPTANFKNRDGQGSNPNFNLGSGAWDYSVTTLFNLKFKQSGLNTQFNYTFKTENDKRFQFGNQTDISILYFRTVNWLKNQPLNLFSGIRSEFYENNKQYGYVLENSKGYIHNLQIGFNVPLKRVQMGCMTYIPLKQNLMDNRIDAKFKALVYANWNF